MSNLKQLGIGMMMYVQDYDETFTPYAGGNAATEADGWSTLLQPYIKSEQIMVCPSDTPYSGTLGGVPTSYAINLGLGYDVNSASPAIKAYKLAGLTKPSLSIMFCDDMNTVGSSTHWTIGCAGGSGGSGCAGATAVLRPGSAHHLDGANFAYADGHVKWSKMDPASQTVTGMYNFFANGSASGESPTFNLTP